MGPVLQIRSTVGLERGRSISGTRDKVYLYRVKPGSKDTSGLGSDAGQESTPLFKKGIGLPLCTRESEEGGNRNTKLAFSFCILCPASKYMTQLWD